MKKISFPVLIIAISLLSGCASIPTLTGEQNNMVTEYAAGLLLKYDAENHSRLVDTTAFKDSYNLAKLVHDEAEARYYEELRADEEQRKQEALEQEEANRHEAAPDASDGEDEVDIPVVNYNADIASYLGLNGLTIEYGGFETLKSYPEEDEDVYFSMDATKGNNLLVMYFNVFNNSGDDIEYDMTGSNVSFRFNINNEINVRKLETILVDDLSTYKGVVRSGSNIRLVLITEIEDSVSVNSLSMTMRKEGYDSVTKTLK